MKRFLLYCLFLIFLKTSTLWGQSSLDNDLKKAQSLYSDGHFGQAYQAFEEISPKLLNSGKMSDWMLSQGRIMESRMYFQGNINAADSILRVCNQYLKNTEPLFKAHYYYFKGIYHDYNYESDSALYYLKLAEGQVAKDPSLWSFRAEIAQNMGNVYRWSYYNYYQGEKYYRIALDLLEGHSENRLLASVYYNLSTVLRLKGDYEGGLEMAYKALSLYKKVPSNTQRQTTGIYNTIANIYYETNRFNKAIETSNKLLTSLTDQDQYLSTIQLDLYHNISAYSFDFKDFENGNRYLNLASEIIEKYGTDKSRQSDHYLLLVTNSTYLGKKEEVELNFNNCKKIRLELFGEKHPKTANLWQAKSNFYFNQKAFEKALEYAQKSIAANLAEFNPKTNLENPDTITYTGKALINSFLIKADALLAMYQENKQTKFLFQAFDSYQNAIKVIDLNRADFDQEQSQLIAAEASKLIYEKALNCLYVLQENAPLNKTNGLAFEIMNKSKAVLLREEIKKNQLLKNAGVPDSLMAVEAELRSQLSILRSKLQALADKPDEEVKIREEIFDASKKLEHYKKELSKQYPAFAELKYGKSIGDLSRIKENLNKQNSSIVEYLWGENALYALVITSDSEKLYKLENGVDKKTELKQLVTNIRKFSSTTEVFEKFTSHAFSIYQSWWLPFEDKLSENVIIIPDGPLSFLPFEALLTKEVSSASVNYKNLPYLILQKKITYNYSSDIEGSKRNNSNKILAMSYSEPNALDEEGYDPLSGAFQEVEEISKMLDGEFLYGAQANKNYFHKNAHKFGLIHLALHGVADTSTYFKNYIHFRASAEDDGNLYIHELYNLKLDNTQVMLSACETGIGEDFSGEGVFSLGRAFIQAGASSVIQSLWKVSDRASLQIITEYYKEIKNETESGTALRQSKLQFLIQSDELSSHPSLWAAWCHIGEEQQKENHLSKFGYYYLLMIIILGSTFVWLSKRKLRLIKNGHLN